LLSVIPPNKCKKNLRISANTKKLSTTDGPTTWAVKKILHEFAAKSLSVGHDTAASMFKIPLITALIISPKGCFLPALVLTLHFIPDIIQFLSPLCIDVPFLNSQDEVVQDDTTPDPHYHP
jgi:hypothetical protein